MSVGRSQITSSLVDTSLLMIVTIPCSHPKSGHAALTEHGGKLGIVDFEGDVQPLNAGEEGAILKARVVRALNSQI